MEYFVRAGALAGYFELVSRLGGNPIELVTRANLFPSQTYNPDQMISYRYLGELLESTAQAVGHDCFGAELSVNQGLSTVGLLGAYMAQQPTVGEALLVAKKHAYMHAQGAQLERVSLAEGIERLSLELEVNHHQNFRQLMLLSMGVVLGLLQELTGPGWKAHKLCLRQSVGELERHQLEQFYQCKVEGSYSYDAIYFASEDLLRAPQQNSQLINSIIDRQFRYADASHRGDVALIEHAIRMLLPTGDCNKDNVAMSVGMHAKKMERILADQQLSFRQLLERTRKDIAGIVIEQGRMELTELALNLGYSEFSAFSRSFKQWFGCSPRAFRKATQAAAATVDISESR